MTLCVGLVVLLFAAVSAFPSDPVLRKVDEGLRYQYVQGPDGQLHLSDAWLKLSDVAENARYNPDRQNVFHLFTRQNPTVSQPLLTGVDGLIGLTNYDAKRRTIILIHGWLDSVSADFNTVLVPAFLSAEDLNVIVVDWSTGAGSVNYFTALANTVPAGESIARFITWLNRATGADASMYHIVGHSLGGHMAGIIARNIQGDVAYITALDPASPGWYRNEHKLRPGDSAYTEVIHTNAGVLGYLAPLGHADFYPNRGIDMPGCNSQECDHARSYFYFGESLISGGFTGRRCSSYVTAMTGNCFLWGDLRMGGIVPKTGSSGIYYLVTRPLPPFSRG